MRQNSSQQFFPKKFSTLLGAVLAPIFELAPTNMIGMPSNMCAGGDDPSACKSHGEMFKFCALSATCRLNCDDNDVSGGCAVNAIVGVIVESIIIQYLSCNSNNYFQQYWKYAKIMKNCENFNNQQ